MPSVIKRIKKFNTGRIPDLLEIKYQRMRENDFRFFRGSCHLFYEDMPSNSFLHKSPLVWTCGDLHLENFGSYKADNRLVYFDINDFDESALAPCLFDVSRVLVSMILATDSMKTDKNTVLALCKNYLDVYAETLRQGHARLLEKELAQGVIKYFLEKRICRKRKDFIDSRTVKSGKKIKLLIDNKHVSKLDPIKKEEIRLLLDQWAKTQPQHDFYNVLDVGYRIAGTGSMGLERYVLLVEGKGAESHYLLDMKISTKSCLVPSLKTSQPKWLNEAERIIQVQKRMQAFPLALLSSINFHNNWFVLKELQPSEDKMDLALCKGKPEQLLAVISTFANITAWDQLRSGGRQGSACTDELIKFATTTTWQKNLISYSRDYANQVRKDYQKYCEAYDEGYFH